MRTRTPEENSTNNDEEVLAAQVFDHLSRCVLESSPDPRAAERQLWLLPDIAVQYTLGAVCDNERRRVDAIVHRLRSAAGALINLRLDRSAHKRMLAAQIAAAREQFVLRPWQSADAPALAQLLDNRRLWEYLPDEYPGTFTEALATDLIEISNGWAERHLVQAVQWQGRPVGQVRLQFDSMRYADSAEISYWLGEQYWGRGFATRIIALFTAQSFRQRPNLERLFANVLDGNAASMRVLEKAGYRYESFLYRNVKKHGALRSTHVYSLCRGDYD